jgi:hypothetical protein
MMHCFNQLTIEAENLRRSGANIRESDEICDALGSQSSARTCAGRSEWIALILIDLSQVSDVALARRWVRKYHRIVRDIGVRMSISNLNQ